MPSHIVNHNDHSKPDAASVLVCADMVASSAAICYLCHFCVFSLNCEKKVGNIAICNK